MSKKGKPRNQKPPEKAPKISRQQLDSQVTILSSRFADLAKEINQTVSAFNQFIRDNKLPKDEDIK